MAFFFSVRYLLIFWKQDLLRSLPQSLTIFPVQLGSEYQLCKCLHHTSQQRTKQSCVSCARCIQVVLFSEMNTFFVARLTESETSADPGSVLNMFVFVNIMLCCSDRTSQFWLRFELLIISFSFPTGISVLWFIYTVCLDWDISTFPRTGWTKWSKQPTCLPAPAWNGWPPHHGYMLQIPGSARAMYVSKSIMWWVQADLTSNIGLPFLDPASPNPSSQ